MNHKLVKMDEGQAKKFGKETFRVSFLIEEMNEDMAESLAEAILEDGVKRLGITPKKGVNFFLFPCKRG